MGFAQLASRISVLGCDSWLTELAADAHIVLRPHCQGQRKRGCRRARDPGGDGAAAAAARREDHERRKAPAADRTPRARPLVGAHPAHPCYP